MPFHSGAEAAPCTSWRLVSPSDSANLPAGCRGIYVGGAGAVALVGDNDVAVTFTAVPVGTFMPCAAKRVNATGTVATPLIALY